MEGAPLSQQPHSLTGGSVAPHPAPVTLHPFRPEALRRHQEAHDRAVLPRLVSPRTFAVLWLLLALIAAATAAAWCAFVPTDATGAGSRQQMHQPSAGSPLPAPIPSVDGRDDVC